MLKVWCCCAENSHSENFLRHYAKLPNTRS